MVRLTALLAAALLAGCGGGGDGDGVPVSGLVRLVPGTVGDGDSNDPNALLIPNDTPAQAQVLENPASSGGFVSGRPTGRAGDVFEAAADRSDFYRVVLAAGQAVSVTRAGVIDALPGSAAAPLPAADVDLRLLSLDGDPVTDPGGQPVDTLDQAPAPVKSLVSPANGEFVLEVRATINSDGLEGVATYNLGLAGGLVAALGLAPPADFVPGQVVVRLRDEAAAPGLQGLRALGGGPGRTRLYALDSAPGRAGALPRLDHPASADATLARVAALRADPRVAFAAPNYRVRPLLEPTDLANPDPRYADQRWHYQLIGLPQAWQVSTGDPAPQAAPGGTRCETGDVVVAVVDTGIVAAHPDLDAKLVDGFDFISDPQFAGDGDGLDPDPSDPGEMVHGTHVAGTVGAEAGNGEGGVGVSWGTCLMPLRAVSEQGGTLFDVLQAARYAAGLPNDSGLFPSRPADIINFSLGGAAGAEFEAAFREIRDQAVMMFAAAGNDGAAVPVYPAALESVVGVGAVGPQGLPAGYSNSGDHVGLVAPGGTMPAPGQGVLSTWLRRPPGVPALELTYAYLVGTSMATPHVSGVAALMESASREQGAGARDLGPGEFGCLLTSGALTVPPDGLVPGERTPQLGFGLLDAAAAVTRAREFGAGAPLPEAFVQVSPGRLDLGTLFDRAQVSATLACTEGQVRAAVDVPWLQVTPLAPGGPFAVQLDRSDPTLVPAADGSPVIAQASLMARADAVEPALVPVVAIVGAPAATPGAGALYLQLRDLSGGVLQLRLATDAAGLAPFRFAAVSPGTYDLLVSTDLDNDGLLCDAGEACQRRSGLQVGPEGRSGLELNLTFLPPAITQARGLSAEAVQRRRQTD